MSLTFPVSRWHDIPFAFLLVNMYAWILRIYYRFALRFAKKDDLVVGLVTGLVTGLGVLLFSFSFWKSIYSWFAAKNIS